MNATERIYKARRELDRIPEVVLTQDVEWDEEEKAFFLEFTITLKDTNQYIDTKTAWVAVLNKTYPEGDVRIYPSANGGIKTTYPHQDCNNFVVKSEKWRSGKLCLNDPLSAIDKNYEIEPLTVEKRLLWNVQRAVQWVKDAAASCLLKNDDFFEVPEFFGRAESLLYGKVVVLEDDVSFMQWEDATCNCGLAEIGLFNKKNKLWAVKKFMSTNPKESLCLSRWGQGMTFEQNVVALWLLLPKMSVVNHWQVPKTYSELESVCEAQNLSFFSILKKYAYKIRDRLPHAFLLGYSIPNRIGEEKSRIIWQAMELPVLSCGKKTAAGFRANEKGYWQNDRQNIFSKGREIAWVGTENWEHKSIISRGHLVDNLLSKRILIVGAGCIGSATAELLARTGCRNLIIVDCDNLQIGNLCRHTLTMESVGSPKSTALAQRLNTIGPHMNAKPVNTLLKKEDLVNSEKTNLLSFGNFDAVFDCTGSDDVLQMFDNIENKSKTIFVSISIDLGANHLYVNLQNGLLTDTTSVKRKIYDFQQETPLSCEEIKRLPRDGIGCWHPLFPARSDEIWMAVSTAFGAFETFCFQEKNNNILCVYKKQEGYNCAYLLIEKQEL